MIRNPRNLDTRKILSTWSLKLYFTKYSERKFSQCMFALGNVALIEERNNWMLVIVLKGALLGLR